MRQRRPGPIDDPLAAGLRSPAWKAPQSAGHAETLQPKGEGDDAGRFVHAFVPPPLRVPRTRRLDSSRPVPGTLLDGDGRGIDLSPRLPDTGRDLREQDENLRLDLPRSVLELTTTPSDLNIQFGLLATVRTVSTEQGPTTPGAG